MSIENPTLVHFRHFSSLLTDFPFTLVVSALQINLFMQNKANFRKSQMNVNELLTRDYEKRTLGEHGKNEPKTNPIKANKMPKQTQLKPNLSRRSLWRRRKQTQFQRRPNHIHLPENYIQNDIHNKQNQPPKEKSFIPGIVPCRYRLGQA